METVISSDGTKIAYDVSGEGPTVILVGGALSFRKFKGMEELARLLSDRCTVINYDRRGRGDSTDTAPFALEREVEDIAALIEAAGGRASLWGWSSGGALALHAAKAEIGVERISIYEVPFITDPSAEHPTNDYGQRLDELVAADDRDAAVKHFMRNSMGIPAPFVLMMRVMPIWRDLRAVAHTLPYDWLALGSQRMYGAPIDADEWASITMPTLVVAGEKSPEVLRSSSRALAAALPNASFRELAGVSHSLKMTALAPVLAEFFRHSGTAAARAGHRRSVAHRTRALTS
jgi:pimeloyl-ACP methyl ester carboxylesterase